MVKKRPAVSHLDIACCGCGACVAKCPKKCIQMVPDSAGFMRPKVDLEVCVGCGGCDSVCPAINKQVEDSAILACWAKSDDRLERLASSSGGVFALIAHDVLSEGGVVVGAAWGQGCKTVHHVLIEDEERLETIMRSKYVQSSIGLEVYQGVRSALCDGRRVLFVGTACQVAGMRAYLGHIAESDKYLAVDIICHGTPSPLLWVKWAEYKEQKANATLSAVNMRNKVTGWQSYSIQYGYTYNSIDDGSPDLLNSRSDICHHDKDWYMRAFLANVCLRSSCHVCPAKRSCGSDLTLGDFWGIQLAHPEVDIEGGVSAVVCNTPRGLAVLDAVKPLIEWGESSFDRVLAGNPSLMGSVAPHPKREGFMRDLAGGMGIEEMVSKYDFEPTLGQKLRSKLRTVKRRLLGVARGRHG